jgi:hypothetical protein
MSVLPRGLHGLGFHEAPEFRLWAVHSLCWRMAGGLIESHIAPAFANGFGPAFWEMPCMSASWGLARST